MRTADRRGFTLIELLLVIVIIGILLGLLSPALLRARRNAYETQASAERATLRAAIWNYRQEYGRWPVGETEGTVVLQFDGAFQDRLSPEHADNPRGVYFVNWSEYRESESGLIVNRRTGVPYTIRINLDEDKVTVE